MPLARRTPGLVLLALCIALPAQADIKLAPGKAVGDLQTITAAPLQDDLLKPKLDTSAQAHPEPSETEKAAPGADVRAQFEKGVGFAQAGQQAEAITIFTQMIESYPTLPEPYNNLAVIYADQGNYEKAQKLLERVIKIHPDYATAQENLGDIYIKMAAEAYGKSLQLDGANKRAQTKQQQTLKLVTSFTEPEDHVATVPATTATRTAARAAKMTSPESVHEVTLAINGWLQAWESKNVAAYLASYTEDFVGQNETSHANWVKTRTARIGGANSISVQYSKLKIVMENGDTARASFVQSYRSDSYQDRTKKTLVLKKIDGKWLISQELS